jgi:hypothetical protein
MKKSPIEPFKVQVNTATEAEREERLKKWILFVNEKNQINEDALLDSTCSPGGLEQRYLECKKWSERLGWLSQIMANRFIIPRKRAEMIEEEKKKNASGIITPSEADQARLGLKPV